MKRTRELPRPTARFRSSVLEVLSVKSAAPSTPQLAAAPEWRRRIRRLSAAAVLCGALAASAAAQEKTPALKPTAPVAKPKAGSAAKPASNAKPAPRAERGGGPKAPADVKPAAKPAAKPQPTAEAKPKSSPGSQPKASKAKPKVDDSVPFFRDGVIPRLKIQIPDGELQRLRQQNREYVRCTVVENDETTYEHVGIHLKGAAGSFRGLDDRPALTLNFDKYKDKQEFHDLDKIHLNNSVQDPSYLNELMSSELFLAAGVPAARTTHARVWLNGRDLGFYVLKEGFNKGFIKRHFPDPDGNLYEGGFVQDLDGQPKLQSGSGPVDRSDVKAVVAACREGDPAKRWERLQQVVDIDQFLSFMALELLTCHWDGYCNNRNNYRYYFEPKSGKIHFFPHGMDQMFADPNASVLNVPGAMVAGAVMSNPEWRGRYRDRLTELIRLFSPVDGLHQRLDTHHQRIRPVLAELNAGQANDFDRRVKEFKDRLAAREKSLLQQNAVVEPRPLRFTDSGYAPLTRWEPRQETGARLVLIDTPGDGALNGAFSIAAGPNVRSVASWRTKVILPAGKYRFEARARSQGIKAVEEPTGSGAGLRISGSSRTNKLDGTANWTLVAHEFEIQAPTQQVELVAELRATAGEVFFDASSLRLVRVVR
ncbi:MAG: CotH kinase family protein [Actinomycetota bacterium]